MPQGESQRTLTGSGQPTWYHNHDMSGIADINGNLWEWTGGLRLMDGEIQIIPYGNSMKLDCDMSAESTLWKAIKQDGTLVEPGTAGTLKLDQASASAGIRVNTKVELQYWLRQTERKPERYYYLKMDISKYFYRVDHDILLKILARRIKDQRLLNLLEKIINCESMNFGLPPGKEPDEVAVSDRLSNKGMPIGNLTSQMFANIYLNEVDQYAKHELGLHYYIRYMDDIIILHHDKKLSLIHI